MNDQLKHDKVFTMPQLHPSSELSFLWIPLFSLLGQLCFGEWKSAFNPTARVRRDPVSQRHQMGSPKLGRQWPQTAFQEGL